MARRTERDYEVTVPIRAKDQTGPGVRSAVSNVDRIAASVARSIERNQRAAQSALQREIDDNRRHQNRLTQIAAQGEQQRLTQATRHANQVASARERAAERAADKERTSAERAAQAQIRSAERVQIAAIRSYERVEREAERTRQAEIRAAERAGREQVRIAERTAREEQAARARVGQGMQNVGKGMAGVGYGIQSAGSTLNAGITQPIVGIAARAVQEAAQFDAQRRSLMAITGDAEAVRKKIIELREVAKLPGLGFAEAVQGQVRLQAVGMKADLATRSIAGLGKAIATTGGGRAELERITLQLGQMAAAGKVLMPDLRPILQTAPIISKVIRESFGTLEPKALNAKFGGSQKFIEALIAELEKLPPVTGGIGNDFENFGDTVSQVFVKIGERLVPTVGKVLSFLSVQIPAAVDAALGWFDKLTPTGQAVVVALLAIVTAAGPVLTVLGVLTTAVGAVVWGIGILSAAAGGLLPLFAGVVAAIAAVVGVVGVVGAAIYGLYQLWEVNFGGIRDLTSDAMTMVQNAVNEGLSFIISLWTKHGEDLTNLATGIWLSIGAFLKPIVAEIVAFMQENLNVVVEWTRDNWPMIKSTIEAVLVGAMTVVREVVNSIATLWQAHGTEIKAVVSAAWGVVKVVVQTVLRSVLDIVRLSMQVLHGDWSGAWQTFVRIVDRAQAATMAVLGLIVNGLWNLVKLASEAATNVGNAIVMGIVNALKAGVGLVAAAAREMAIAPLRVVIGLLQISSPSRVFFGIGRNIALGMALGITAGAGQVQAAAQDLVRLTIPEKPETATGKGAAKVNKARRDKDNEDRPGYDLLERLYADIDQLAPAEEKTRRLAVVAELAKAKYRDLKGEIREALIAAAEDFDQKKASIDVQKFLNDQLDQTEKQLIKLRHPIGENATELEKFEVELRQAAAASPAFREALASMGPLLDQVRKALREVDTETSTRKAQKEATDLRKAVSQLAEDAWADLRRLGKTDTELDKVLERFTKLKGVSISLAQLDPLQHIAASVEALPKPERLNAIAKALERIFAAANFKRPEGMDEQQWQVLISGVAEAADSSHQQDVGSRTARGVKTYDDQMKALNGKLTENVELTERARLAKELEGEAYKDLTQAQKDSLLQRASEVDALLVQREQVAQLTEEINRYAEAVTDVIGGAFDRLLEGDFKGFWSEIRSGFADLWRDVVGGLFRSGIKSAFQSVFRSIFDSIGISGRTSPSSVATGGGGGGGGVFGGIGSIITNLFGGGSASGGDAPVAPPSVSGSGGGFVSRMLGALGLGGNGSSTGAASGVARGAGGLAGSLASSLGPLAPLLGLGGGASLGGRYGGTLGMIGGGILGGIGGLLGGGMAITALTGVGAFSSFGALSAFAPLLPALGPLAAIAAPLLIGGILLQRNQVRRREEGVRNQASVDTRTRLLQILQAVQTDRMDGDAARDEIAQLHTKWIEVGNSLTDRKTRDHHMATWGHFQPIIAGIETAIGQQASRATARERMSPVFAGGGYSVQEQLIRVRPGEGIQYPGSATVFPVTGPDRGFDTEFRHVPRGTRIYTQSEMRGSPGHQQGGFAGGGPVETGEKPTLEAEFNFELSPEGLMNVLVRSPHFKDLIVRGVEIGKKKKRIA